MNPPMQPGNVNISQSLPVKRKRGRPRKDQSQSANRVGVPQVPPGFEKSRPVSKPRVQELNSFVGQAVNGVIEASFDNGYLLAVRVGNSRTILRGVVFNPGNYVPVTSQNDLAPGVPMIHRNPVNLPFIDQTPPPFSMDFHSPQPQANVVRPKSSALCDVPIVGSVGGRGHVVPVVLQPLGPANGVAPVVNQDASSSKGKEKDVVAAEPLAMLPPVLSASSSHFQVQGVHGVHGVQQVQVPVQGQGNHNQFPISDAAVAARGGAQEESSQSSEGSGGTSNTESDQEASYFQTPVPSFRSDHASGRMTELLQVLQDNFENQGQMPPAPVDGSEAGPQVNGHPDINFKAEMKD